MTTRPARRSGPLLWLLLASILAALVAACGAGEDPGHGGAPAVERGDAGTAAADGGALLGDEHHGVGAMRCSRCHTEEDKKHPKWRETAMRLGHDIGKTFEDRTTCKCCHLGEVKGFGDPIDRRCAECHDDIRVTITAMGSMHCVSCHDPMASGGMAIRESAWECLKCHDKDQGNKLAIDVHATEDCSNCHRPHSEPWTLPRLCTDCHVGHETWHAAVSGAGGGAPSASATKHGAGAKTGEPMACATCHPPHEVAGAASGRCFACHAAKEPEKFTAASTFAGGHDRCTTCHEPHGDGATAVPRACRACHTTIATMDGRASEAHSRCVNCHQPHEVSGSARTACVGCHLSVKADHPDPEGVGCTGCHEVHPHPAGPSRAIVSASLVAALPDTAYPRAPSPVTCSHCHTKASSDLGFHDGKTACKSCHTPHEFSPGSVAACSSCHAREAAAAVAAGGGHGHEACKACHEPHAPTAAKPACGSCHAEEARTAPAGHAKCTGCHDAHPASRTPKAACTTCHAEKTHGPHAPVPCASCHRPHGPDAPTGPPGAASVPPCLSCHTASKLPALHEVKEHETCASCHGAHAAPKGDRATCLSCHADKKDHEPTATKCIGCHVFGRGKWAPPR